MPILYLRGLSTGDFKPALERAARRGRLGLVCDDRSADCAKEWEADHARVLKAAAWGSTATPICSWTASTSRSGSVRTERLCLLIVIGVREDGEKELLAVEDGYRESTESWAGVFRDMKRRGLNEPEAW